MSILAQIVRESINVFARALLFKAMGHDQAQKLITVSLPRLKLVKREIEGSGNDARTEEEMERNPPW